MNLDTIKINVTRHQMGGLLSNEFTCTVMTRVCAAAIQAVEGSAAGGLGSRKRSAKKAAMGQPKAAMGQPKAATGGEPSIPAQIRLSCEAELQKRREEAS